MPNVGYIRKELSAVLPLYAIVKDCLAGEKVIKEKGILYLPMPNPEDQSYENLARYKSYKERAVFYNVTRRTLSGITGMVFVKNIDVQVPAELDAVVNDANGEGVTLSQTSKRAMQYGLGFGRGGLFIDYPDVPDGATRDEIENGNIRPTITFFSPWSIINWRTITVGSKKLLSLVVIEEPTVVSDDGFEISEGKQWRVLKLVSNGSEITDSENNQKLIYMVEIWNKDAKGTKSYTKAKTYYPRDYNGEFFNEIPFKFIGAENNDSEVDHPPMYDLAALNIAHYRNSADYEESSFIVGQPTPWFSGLTEEWAKEILNGKIALGSRGAVPLPQGGAAGLLQADPNNLPFEAMKHKEDQMIALGAKLVEIKAGNRTTATEAEIDDASETSILVNVSKNVSDAFLWALRWCCRFVGADEESVTFKIDSDLEITKLSAQDQQQIVANWQAGAMAHSEVRHLFKGAGLTYGKEEEVLAEIEKEKSDRALEEEKKLQKQDVTKQNNK